VEPRFTAVDPSSRYSEEAGFGWLSDGEREAVAIPLTPYHEMRAVTKEPQNLPHDRLLRDYIRGRGAQEFALKADPGEYRVLLLHPDGTVDERKLTAANGRLTIRFAGDAWSMSGIVVKGSKPAPAFPPAIGAASAARPVMRHAPPATAQAESPLSLALDVSGAGASSVRLYYRAVNQLAKFKMLEASPGDKFTIPGSDVSARWDLMYYFEVLNDRKGGWFQPDPLRETPYYVIKVVPGN